MKREKLYNQKKRDQYVMADDLREQIRHGMLQPDDYLLPEKKLAEKYGVSMRVVRECLSTLSAEGWISRQQGRGTVVLAQNEGVDESKKTDNVAVILLQRVRDASTLEFFDILQQTFQQGGYGTTVYVSHSNPDEEAALVRKLIQDGVPGMVLFTAHAADSFQHLKEAQEAGVKVALFDHYFPDLATNFVGIDDQLGAYEATSHLIHSGCEELILINSSQNWTTHRLRERGFHDAVAKLAPKMRCRILSVPNFDTMTEYITEHLPTLLKGHDRKLGLVVWNDLAALAATNCLIQNGLSVPGDAAVIGFADDIDSSLAPVPLTTMKIPREEIARLCAYLLLNQMSHPKLPPQHITVQSRMVIRASCGCYPSTAQHQKSVAN